MTRRVGSQRTPTKPLSIHCIHKMKSIDNNKKESGSKGPNHDNLGNMKIMSTFK